MKTRLVVMTKTEGSGAHALTEELAAQYGYVPHSVRKYLYDEYSSSYDRPPESQQDLKDFAYGLRKENGAGAIVSVILNKILKYKKGLTHTLESVMTLGEIPPIITWCAANDIHLTIIGIDAPVQTRFERLIKHKDFKGERSLEKLSEVNLPVIVAQLLTTEWSQACEKEDLCKINIAKCFKKYVPHKARFQNRDGKLSETAQKVHEYVMST